MILSVVQNFLRLKFPFIFFLFFSLSVSLWSQDYLYTKKVENTYALILQLRFEEAQKEIKEIKTSQADNFAVYHLEHYIDFFKVFIGEERGDFNKMIENSKIRVNKLSQIPKSSPYLLYSQADILLQTALGRLKFEEYIWAFKDIRKAFLLLEENERLFPDFLPNKRNLSLLKAMVGTIPDSYKWGVNILGMHGNLNKGMDEIEAIIAKTKGDGDIFNQETLILYSYLMLHLQNDAERAWYILNNSGLKPSNGPLILFAFSNIALHTGRNDYVINILSDTKFQYKHYQLYYLYFMLGCAKLNRLDSDANISLEKFLNNFKGINYLKLACQKLSWHYLIRGNTALSEKFRDMTLNVGGAVVDEDKKAMRDAEDKKTFHPMLLQSRLLMDGGYYSKAMEILKTLSIFSFSKNIDKIEYSYRYGRCLEELKLYSEAIAQFSTTMEVGHSSPAYFACSAALHTGFIYEEMKMKEKAKEYYKKCLSYNPKEYKTGLHQKAKAGLARLN